MDGRERDFRDAIMEACAPFDVTLAFDRGTKHPYAKISLPSGRVIKSYYPGSTSDRRSVLNNKSQVRRMLKKNEAPLKPTQQTQIGSFGEILKESLKTQKQQPMPELPFMQQNNLPPVQLIRNGKELPDVKHINITKSDEPKYAKLTKDESIQLTRLLAMNTHVEADVVEFNTGWDDARLHKILATVPGREKLSVKTITDFRREHFGLTQEEIKERARVNRPEAYATKGIKAELASFDKRIAKLEALVERLAKDLGV
jgi:hypothetical protein